MIYRAIIAAAIAILVVACSGTPTPPHAPAGPTVGRVYLLIIQVARGSAPGKAAVAQAYPPPTATEEAGYP